MFRLTPEQGLSVLGEVTAATSHWRETAKRNGISASSIEQLAPAFEHGDVHAARGNA